jgi:hypothetical protein
VGEVPAAQLAALTPEVSKLESLDDLLAWGHREPARFLSPATITDVVIQDEFTHDVIVCLSDGPVLVLDAT